MKIYLVAGEPSGDLLGAGLMAALKEAVPGVEFRGVGGEGMAAQGLQSRFDISDISVMGVFEVLPRLRTILRHIRRTTADIEQWQPDVLVTIDSWGFVNSVLGKLKKHGSGIPVVHYVAPQVWAWKKGRAKHVAQVVDRLMMLLPYEGKYFDKYGLRCDFVGHPVMERMQGVSTDPADFRARHGIPADARVVCVLPGSRRSEVSRLTPVFKKALRQIAASHGELWVVVPTVTGVEKRVREGFAAVEGCQVRVVVGNGERYDAFAASSIALAASGTVSLELSALGVPHLIAYTFSPLTNILVRAVIRIPFANLINILSQSEIIPEFVLQRCKPELIARCAERLLDDPGEGAAQIVRAQEILGMLRPHGGVLPSQKAAQVVIEAATRM